MIRVFACLVLLSVGVANAQLRLQWHAPPSGSGTIIEDGAFDRAGNLLLVGSANYSSSVIMAKVAPSGRLLWARLISIGSGGNLSTIVVLPDDSFVTAGSYRVGGALGTVVLKRSPSGEYIRSLFVPDTNPDTVEVRRGPNDTLALMTSWWNLRIITLSIDHDLNVRWRRDYRPLTALIYLGGGGRTTDSIIARIPRAYVNSRTFPYLVVYDHNGTLLNSQALLPDSIEGAAGSSMLALRNSHEVYAGLFALGPDGWRNHLFGFDAYAGQLWHTSFEPTDSLSASSFRVWFDPLDRLMAVWNDQSGFRVLLHIDKETGQVVRGQPLPLPGIHQREGYGLFLSDARGAVYCIGVGYDGNFANLRQMALKLDRNLRPVWHQWLTVSALVSWSTYDRGHLYIMSYGSSAPAPLSKYKILPVFSEGDVNGDECIDDADLAKLLEGYGTADPSLDLNADGIVDGRDLEELLHNFGLGCEG
ncbi:MAG: hypothetical protein HUU60_06090 [Armatimonadetes bacterium]|nr:hypothetical protein [Armatimonadota bacterium]